MITEFQLQKRHLPSDLLERCLEIHKISLGSSDPNIARLLDKMASAFLKRGMPEQAEKVLLVAEKLLESTYYPGHGNLGPVLERLADSLIVERKISQAQVVLKRAQEIYAKTRTMENRDTLRAILKLARLYILDKKPAEAEAVINSAIKHVDTPLGPIAEFRYQLALAYLQENRNDEARNLLETCIAQFRQRHNYGRVADCLELIAKLQSVGNVDHQPAIREEIDKYRRQSLDHPYPEDIFLATLMRA